MIGTARRLLGPRPDRGPDRLRESHDAEPALRPEDRGLTADAACSDRLTADDLVALSTGLQAAAPALARISAQEMQAAWNDTVTEFADPGSPIRAEALAAVAAADRIDPACLGASLDALLRGYSRERVAAVFERGGHLGPGRPTATILAGGVAGLVLQPLLAALALRQPLLIKPASGHAAFPVAFVSALRFRLAALRPALAVVDWRGGDRALEDIVLASWPRIVAYGDGESLAALRRFGRRLIGYGPRFSIGLVCDDASIEQAAEALARDVTLFDQRGCLSIQAIWARHPEELAAALASRLDDVHRRWPARRGADEMAGLHGLRADAELHGQLAGPATAAAGAVIVHSDPNRAWQARPGEGLRSVVVRPWPSSERLMTDLGDAAGWLQGAAIAGTPASGLQRLLSSIGISRIAPAGRLQEAEAGWCNDGIDLLHELSRADETV